MVGLGEPRVGARRRRRRLVLRGHGPAAGDGPAPRRRRRRAEGRRRGGAHAIASGPRAFKSDPAVIGKTIRLSDRPATIVGVLEPSVPYPQETEIIANVVTSPHHLDATMVDGRVHRMTELFGRLAPGADLEAARAELRAVHGAMVKAHPEAYQAQADFRIDAVNLRDQIISPARTILLVLLAASGAGLHRRLLERRQPDPRALGAARRRAGGSRGARRQRRRAAADAARGKPGAVRRGRGAGASLIARPMVAVLARYAARFSVRALDVTVDATLLWVGVGLARGRGRAARVRAAPAVGRRRRTGWACRAAACGSRRARTAGCASSRSRRSPRRSCCSPAPACCITTLFALQRQQTGFSGNVLAVNVPVVSYDAEAGGGRRVLQGSDPAHLGAARRGAGGARHGRAVARSRLLRRAVHRRGLPEGQRRRGSARAVPHRVAGILLGAGRADRRRPRLQRRRSRATARKSSSSARAWRSGCSRTWTR